MTTPACLERASSTESMAYFSKVSELTTCSWTALFTSTMYSAPSTSNACNCSTMTVSRLKLRFTVSPERTVTVSSTGA